jgi:hypothetical protein
VSAASGSLGGDHGERVIASINRLVAREGRELHVECEERGGIAWSKRFPYDELLARELPRHELEQELHRQMEKTVQTVAAAIGMGRLP